MIHDLSQLKSTSALQGRGGPWLGMRAMHAKGQRRRREGGACACASAPHAAGGGASGWLLLKCPTRVRSAKRFVGALSVPRVSLSEQGTTGTWYGPWRFPGVLQVLHVADWWATYCHLAGIEPDDEQAR